MIAVDVCVIVTFNAGCKNRNETCNVVFELLESDNMWVGETNEKEAPTKSDAPNTAVAEPEVE